MAETQEFIATGRRKTAVARIRMMPGNGKIDVNGKSFEDYFPTVPLQNTVLAPLQVVKLAQAYDISVNTSGGGADRSGRSCAARDFARVVASGRESSRHAESRRIAQTRSADEGTEEVRTTGRAQAVPVLEAISDSAGGKAVPAHSLSGRREKASSLATCLFRLGSMITGRGTTWRFPSWNVA